MNISKHNINSIKETSSENINNDKNNDNITLGLTSVFNYGDSIEKVADYFSSSSHFN